MNIIKTKKGMLASLKSEIGKRYGVENINTIMDHFGIYVENNPEGGFELGANSLWLSTNNFMDYPVVNRFGVKIFLDELEMNVGTNCELVAAGAVGYGCDYIDWGEKIAAVVDSIEEARLIRLGDFEKVEDYFSDDELENMCGDIYDNFADYIENNMYDEYFEYEKTAEGIVLGGGDYDGVQSELLHWGYGWLDNLFDDYVAIDDYKYIDEFYDMISDKLSAYDFIYWLDSDIFCGKDGSVLVFTEEFKNTDDYKNMIAA